MAENPWYMEWFSSPFYHKWRGERQENLVPSFIGLLIKKLAPAEGGSLLDTACGTGNTSKTWASRGFDVTGIDLSPANIELAKRYEQERLQFFIHDTRLPFFSNYFDVAVNLFTSFGYYRTRREHEAAIRTMSKSLKPGGQLVIDYLNVHYSEENIVEKETKEIGETQYDIDRWQDDTHFYKRTRISDPSLAKPVEYTEQVAKFSLGDFTDMLSYQGLQVKDVFGDYQLGDYDTRKTPRLIIIAGKNIEKPADKEKRLYSDGRTTDSLT